MKWTLQRKKNNRFILMEDIKNIGFSYVSITLTEESARKLLKYSAWERIGSPNDIVEKYELKYEADPDRFDKILRRFFEVLNENSSKIKKVPNRRFTSTVPGTSRLVRTMDKSKIFIASRTNKKTKKVSNLNTINSICIDNEHRDAFFKASIGCNGYPGDNYFYLFSYNAPEFDWWNKYLDKEYETQLKEYDELQMLKKLSKKKKPQKELYNVRVQDTKTNLIYSVSGGIEGLEMALQYAHKLIGYFRIEQYKIFTEKIS